MPKNERSSAELFINRELSWLEFNHRVLEQGLSPDLPPLERLKFLAIVSSNLDEFFMIRVAGLLQQKAAGVRKRDPSGLTPTQTLALISKRARRMVDQQTRAIIEVFAQLTDAGLCVTNASQWTAQQRQFVRAHFLTEILPVLTPIAIEQLEPVPLLPGQRLYVAVELLFGTNDNAPTQIAVVPVPPSLPRFITIPADHGLHLARLEEIIAAHVGPLFPESRVLHTASFRLTRDADVSIQDDDAEDLLRSVEDAILERRRRSPVRLEISAGQIGRIGDWLRDRLQLQTDDVYPIDGMLDATALMEIVNRSGFEKLKAPDWPPQPPRDLVGAEDLWQAVQENDVLLFHPYESFDPVIRMLQEAAADPTVLAIKQTLYRTSGESPIVQALEQAARNGKQVTVLVELKARFDEFRNMTWARRLEDAGCHVIYGIAGLKTHAKALLIVRRESSRIRRYVHLATGNYNDRTARLYSDLGLLTADRDLTADVAAFFNLLTGHSEAVGWTDLTIAPTDLRQRFLELIDREARTSTPESPGLIMAKVNSLQDPDIARALQRAGSFGVRIMLNVRGICCLRPGVPKRSTNIEVRSIVDRYLEHARIFYFRNAGHEEVYLGSADWMTRNLNRRLEILFPIKNPALRRRAIDILETCFADNLQSRRLLPDGSYTPVPQDGPPFRAQQRFYEQAVEAAQTAARTETRFRPLTRPEV